MRIQILPLPAVMVGDDLEEPFAVIVDQCPAEVVSEWFAGQLKDFAEDCGGKAALVTPETVEIVDRYAADAHQSWDAPLDLVDTPASTVRDWEALATMVRERRLELGIPTQKQAAEAAGVHVNTWNKVENSQPVNAASLVSIARALQWHPSRMLSILREDEDADPAHTEGLTEEGQS